VSFVVGTRIKEATTSTGTGNLTLSGSPSGFRTFSAVATDGDIVPYAIRGTNFWEDGYGHTSSGTFVRDAVISSSNSNTWVDLPSGSKIIYITHPAPVQNAIGMMLYGTGEDGDVTISSGVTTLTGIKAYDALTISGTGQLNPGMYPILVSGVLDLSAAPAGALTASATNGTNNTGTGTGAAAAVAHSNMQIPSRMASQTGGGTTATVGVTPATTTFGTNVNVYSTSTSRCGWCRWEQCYCF
jgi:hypothetical protein